MQESEGPGTDGSWTSWKTLHHQTKDLSPWMTEAARTSHLHDPPKITNPLPSPPLTSRWSDEEIRPNVCRKHWKFFAVVAAILSIFLLAFVPSVVLRKASSRKSAPAPPPPTSTPAVPSIQVQGIATFNDYTAQGGTVCSGAKKPTTADNSQRFAAAAGDISKDISPGLCEGSHSDMDFPYDTSICTADNGQAPPPTYTGPACPSSNCGTCYRVDNLGPYDSYTNDTVYGSVVVEIVDACPAGHALNYCKTDVPRDERCGSNRTNSLDIDVHAYNKLTNGVDWSVGQPNLRINITLNVPCNGTLKT